MKLTIYTSVNDDFGDILEEGRESEKREDEDFLCRYDSNLITV